MKDNTQRIFDPEAAPVQPIEQSIRAYPCQGLDSLELKVVADGVAAGARLVAFLSGLSESEAVAEVRTEEHGFRVVFRPETSEEYVWSLARSIMLIDFSHPSGPTDPSHTRPVK